MQQTMTGLENREDVTQRTQALFDEHRQRIFQRTDRIFAGLMAFQWIAGIVAAFLISPHTWAGQQSQTHLHVWAAVLLGGVISVFPILIAVILPGHVLTRHTIAVGQMLMSALLIHLTGGRIETHFHVFGSLAFLAFYRDWRVILSASAVVAIDHVVRGLYLPQSVYGVLTATPWRAFEHAGWVIFEDIFLINSTIQSVKEMWDVAARQAALEKANEALQAEIAERKQKAKELKAFTAKLEQSNRELQDFAYVSSHDLQEPLRKIQAFGDRLKAKCGEMLNEEGRDYLQRMQSAAKRMQTLINDLLTFSRVTTKGQPFVPVPLEQIAREVLSDLEVRAEQLGARVEIGDLATIDADPLQMRQLLQNLMGNALKFHRDEEVPLVKISTQILNGQGNGNGRRHDHQLPNGHAPEESVCRLVVQDNGIGFDEKYLDRIFAPFQRLHGRNEYEGTGIGLAICRKIVERHGGSITAQSAPGQGATFTVTLPIKQIQEQTSNGK